MSRPMISKIQKVTDWKIRNDPGDNITEVQKPRLAINGLKNQRGCSKRRQAKTTTKTTQNCRVLGKTVLERRRKQSSYNGKKS